PGPRPAGAARPGPGPAPSSPWWPGMASACRAPRCWPATILRPPGTTWRSGRAASGTATARWPPCAAGSTRAPAPAVPPDAVAALAADPEAVVDDLLGRGGGLTPAGDDLLAGCLAALRARRSPAGEGLCRAVGRRGEGETRPV